MSSSAKIGIGNTSFVFPKIRKLWLDSLLLFLFFSSPNVPISSVSLVIHLVIVNVPIISVFANLMKNYFKPFYCRDKCSITKTDKFLRKLFEVIYLNHILRRSNKRDFDSTQITVPCGTNLILLFCYQCSVFFGSIIISSSLKKELPEVCAEILVKLQA